MKYVWEDLPKPLNCFTVMNTAMVNLNTGKAIRHYSTNTKIVVVQKCVTPECTYYRTSEAEHHYLNYAFKASALGLPNEKAPSAPSAKSNSSHTLSNKKQTSVQKVVSSDGGEKKRRRNWFSRIFRGKNG